MKLYRRGRITEYAELSPFFQKLLGKSGEWLAPPGAAREAFTEDRTSETGLRGGVGALRVEPAERTLFRAERTVCAK